MKGFTLIETILYIALFSLIIFGALASTYGILENNNNLSQRINTGEEGNFVLHKIDWALSNIDLTNLPTISGTTCTDQTITIHKIDSTIINMRMNNGNIELQENSLGFVPITTINASTTCLQFQKNNTTPTSITATATIDKIDFVINKYLK